MSRAEAAGELRLLAERHGVQTSYKDAFEQQRQVGEESLLRVLQALGEPIESPADAGRLLGGEERAARARDELPPVVVAWEGELEALRLAPGEARSGLSVSLALEDGSVGDELIELLQDGSTLATGRAPLPYGLHELVVDRSGTTRAADVAPKRTSRLKADPDVVTVISAPRRARPLSRASAGGFVPAYALWTEEGEGGHLGLLARLGAALSDKGATYLSTLPLLCDLGNGSQFPNPYSPGSRLFWHEGFLDVAALPEVDLDPASLPRGANGRAERLRPHLAAAERRLLEEGGERLASYERFLGRRPDVPSYARFRAACEAAGPDRRSWPARWRHGLLEDGELEEEVLAAHRYGQFALDEQLSALAARLRAEGSTLMLDLPIGSRPDGYDPWAFPKAFATKASTGAPPDHFFRGGQDWGFPPLLPQAERASGYAVTRACLRNLLRHAGALRVDHVLGLSRLWWVPEGLAPSEGAYVSYPTEELLALYCLEAWRADASLVGENLGTVEESLTDALAAHGIAGMKVAVFDLETERAHPMEPFQVATGTVALVDTHDTATFAGWYSGRDIALRQSLGLSAPQVAAEEERSRRQARRTLEDRLVASELLAEESLGDVRAVHRGLLSELGRSEADLVLVNLEDCWGEVEAQNLPGVVSGHENFSRPVARPLEALDGDGAVSAAFESLTQARAVSAISPPDAG